MDDLIKRKDAIDAILVCCSLEQDDEYACGYDDGLRKAIFKLKRLPSAQTVDAVKHGEWIVDGMNEYELSYGCTGYEPRYRCSCCGIITESYLRTEKPIMPEDASFPDYCPNCGAKMDVTDINVGDKMDGE